MKRAQVHKNIQVPEHVEEEIKIRQPPYTSTLENNFMNNNNSIEKQKIEQRNNNTITDMDILSKKLQPFCTDRNAEDCQPEIIAQNDQPSARDFEDSLEEKLFVPGNADANEADNQKQKPPRIRRISDVIDCIGDEADTDKENRRLSSHSTPPLTPLFNTTHNTFQLKPETNQLKVDRQQKPAADTIDAAPLNRGEDQDIMMEESFNEKVEANMPTEKYSDEYNMNHPRRGHAVIFNNYKFEEDRYPERKGSDVDVKLLHDLYTELQFEITVYDNKEYGEIKSILDSLSKDDHTDADCLVVTVLTHGIASGYILAKDCPYPVDALWKPFTANKCVTLAGKPKIFFIQACRGDKLDRGVRLVNKAKARTVTDSTETSYEIPSHADFLIAYSSAEGHYSFRNPEEGTWFIQCLHSEWKSSADSGDLLKILTRTARRVALDFQSYNDIITWQHGNKQVPSITSMLIRDVYFRPKQQ